MHGSRCLCVLISLVLQGLGHAAEMDFDRAPKLVFESVDPLGFMDGERPVIVPYSAAINPRSFTLDFWMKSDDTRSRDAGSSPLCSGGGGDFGYCIKVQVAEGGTVHFHVGKGSGAASSPLVTRSQPLQQGLWVRLTCSYDAATSTQSLFVDEVLKGTAQTAFFRSTQGPTLIGVNFFGVIREVRIYNGAILPWRSSPALVVSKAPKIVGIEPPHGTGGVDPFTQLVFKFNKRVQRGEGRILLQRDGAADKSGEPPPVVALMPGGNLDFEERIESHWLIISPKVPLAPSEQCCAIFLEPAVVRDMEGNAYEGNDNGGNTYRICIRDSTTPELVSTDPPSGARNVPVDVKFNLRFDEVVSVDLVRISGTIKALDSMSTIRLLGSATGDTNTVQLQPGSSLLPGTTYEVQLARGGITDLAGNPFQGLVGYNVTTAGSVRGTAASLAEAESENSLVVVWALLGVTLTLCVCTFAAWRLKVASDEAREHYAQKIEPSPVEEMEVNIEDPKSYRAGAADGERFDASGTFNRSFSAFSRSGMSNTGGRSNFGSSTRTQDSRSLPRVGSLSSGSAPFKPPPKKEPDRASFKPQPGTDSKKASKDAEEKRKRSKETEDALERSGVQVLQAREICEGLHRQMDQRRSEPISQRRAFFKQLLLRWHPDKSDSEYASDIVRFIQEQRTWFLQE